MSRQLISRNPDLKQLRDEGYHVDVHVAHLLLKTVPYVNAKKEIRYGTLVSDLQLQNDSTVKPDNHVVHFAGERPCDSNGAPLDKIISQSGEFRLFEGCTAQFSFSSKPAEGYRDYHHKMSTYAAMLSSHAQVIDASVTPRCFPVIPPESDDSIFHYLDSASSRAGIAVVSQKLEKQSQIGIVGLGGTGSYILDLVAKTPVSEIHLFDGDLYHQHNAFRSPGAASKEQLGYRPTKVAYFQELYSKMRRSIIAHPYYIDSTNVAELQAMTFVFVCVDRGPARKLIVESLEHFGIPFIDTGMGVQLTDDALGGIVRVTASTPAKRDHVRDKHRIPLADVDAENEYARNIQVADLNALSAALAVIKWKQFSGFYRDLLKDHHATYTIDSNMLISEDRP